MKNFFSFFIGCFCGHIDVIQLGELLVIFKILNQAHKSDLIF